MKLRPHHLLCIQKFAGLGYDEAFTSNMTAVCRQLSESPDMSVTLCTGCDDLCACCPHSASGSCDSEEKVHSFDSAVLAVCGLQSGTTLQWSSLRSAVLHLILQTDEFDRICACCQWYAICRRMEALHESEKISHG